jgi:DNA (cytosine-5)-methyltransferase 1
MPKGHESLGSYLCFLEQEEDCLQVNGLSNGEPSAMSNGTNIANRFCKLESEMGSYTMHPYGAMCEHLMANRGKGELMLSVLDFHANHSALQEKESPVMISETGGLIPFALLGKYNPDLYSLKMSKDCSVQWIKPKQTLFFTSELFSKTWPKAGIMQDGMCYQHPSAEHRINENEYGLWPTPTVNGNYNRKGLSKTSGDGLATAVKKFATPNARNWKGPTGPNWNHETLPDQLGGQLNPNWVDWLMGWPIGWSASKHLEMGKFLLWLQQHGIC